jgi:hypothetical protein
MCKNNGSSRKTNTQISKRKETTYTLPDSKMSHLSFLGYLLLDLHKEPTSLIRFTISLHRAETECWLSGIDDRTSSQRARVLGGGPGLGWICISLSTRNFLESVALWCCLWFWSQFPGSYLDLSCAEILGCLCFRERRKGANLAWARVLRGRRITGA